ncbi:hypothetical protein R1sor_026717 [Riccia sorocarpa]|uniref:Reverse transcriptase zinc-binding domain-containing protein n=1 Tax=Riccia sorocarpa TaxID=122646 RepID=A0ABD3GE98_9MARC
MVEDPRDTSGHSNLLSGAEKETFQRLRTKFNLTDARFIAEQLWALGIQQLVQGTVKWSVLDRCYLNITSPVNQRLLAIAHHAEYDYSEHFPVSLAFQLHDNIPSRIPSHNTYFKLDQTLLVSPQIRDRLQSMWTDFQKITTLTLADYTHTWQQQMIFLQHEQQIRDAVISNIPALEQPPMIFAMASATLIHRLQKEADDGHIKTVQLSSGVNIVTSWFADDAAVYLQIHRPSLQHLQQLLQLFCSATGSVISYHKSQIRVIGRQRPAPRWFQESGCRTLPSTEISRYLGLYFALTATQQNLWNHCYQSILHRILAWQNNYISFEGRLILLKYVLAAIPVYTLALLQVTITQQKQLHRLFANFLWGHSDQGKPKVHLVPWDLIARTVRQGGLGLVSMEITNKACFARAALHFLLAADQQQWMLVTEDTLSSTTNPGGRTAMLLNTTSLLPKMSFIGSLQRAWQQISHKLSFTAENSLFPITIKPYQIISLYLQIPLLIAKHLANSLYQVGLTTTSRIWEFRAQLALLLPESASIRTLQTTLLSCHSNTSSPLSQNAAWTWEGKSPGLQLANPLQQFKRWILDTTDTTPQQYSAKRWHIQWTDRTWQQWIAATTSNWHPRDTAWLWRLAFAAFYTGERADILRQQQTKCTWCDHDPESIQHLFLTCPRWSDIRSQVKRLLPNSEYLQTGSLLLFLAQAKEDIRTRAVALIVLQLTRNIWKLRCKHRYGQQRI